MKVIEADSTARRDLIPDHRPEADEITFLVGHFGVHDGPNQSIGL